MMGAFCEYTHIYSSRHSLVSISHDTKQSPTEVSLWWEFV